jgi:hypothetical protein
MRIGTTSAPPPTPPAEASARPKSSATPASMSHAASGSSGLCWHVATVLPLLPFVGEGGTNAARLLTTHTMAVPVHVMFVQFVCWA